MYETLSLNWPRDFEHKPRSQTVVSNWTGQMWPWWQETWTSMLIQVHFKGALIRSVWFAGVSCCCKLQNWQSTVRNTFFAASTTANTRNTKTATMKSHTHCSRLTGMHFLRNFEVQKWLLSNINKTFHKYWYRKIRIHFFFQKNNTCNTWVHCLQVVVFGYKWYQTTL